MTTHHQSTNPYQGFTREKVLATMQHLVQAATRNHYQMGLLYNYVVESNLLEGTEYKNALDFICDNVQEVSRTALVAYGAVARGFTEKVAEEFGLTRLYVLLAYKKAAQIEVNHAEPGGTFILVPGKGGEVKPKPFAQCSVDELRNAVARLRSTPRAPLPAEDRTRFDGYRDAILHLFPKDTPVRVQLRNLEGKAVMDFKGIPMSGVDTLIQALQSKRAPTPELPEVPELDVEIIEDGVRQAS